MVKRFVTHPRILPVLESFYANFPDFIELIIAIYMHNKVYGQPEYQDIVKLHQSVLPILKELTKPKFGDLVNLMHSNSNRQK